MGYLQHGALVDSLSSQSKPKSPVLVMLFIHKAICNELDVLHHLAMGYAMGQDGNLGAFLERGHFLILIYENYLNVKDEVIFGGVDARVKNIAQTYFCQHIGEKTPFDHLCKLISSVKDEESFPKELAFFTGALQTLFGQYMTKEEEQVLPVLIQTFSFEEQASLVWKLLCSIPTNVVAKLLPWLSSSVSPDEYNDLHKCLTEIVPEEKLLQEVIFSWMEGKDSCASRICETDHETNNFASDFTGEHPIDNVLLWHNAIKKELSEILEEAKKIHIAGAVTCNLSAFYGKLQFIAEVCIYHSIAEAKVIYPAVYGEILFFQEHKKQESLLKELRRLTESIQKAGTISSSVAEFHSNIYLHADQITKTLMGHFYDEEVEVLPLVRKHFSISRQRELLHQSLCVMPLKLIECVLPWLVNLLTENEARNYLRNMQLGAPASDIALVRLFCGWTSKALNDCFFSNELECCPVKRFANIDEKSGQSSCTCASTLSPRDIYFAPYQASNASNSSEAVNVQKACTNQGSCFLPAVPGLKTNNLGNSRYPIVRSSGFLHATLAPSYSVWEIYNSSPAAGLAEQPIDVVFKVHKAIRRDLEYLDNESQRLSNCDEVFLQQFIGFFFCMWGLHRAHSNAEDCVVYPALESRDALHNLSHSYTLEHKQEEHEFEHISGVLLELSHLHCTIRLPDTCGSNFSDCVGKFYELAARLHVMFKSLRIMAEQHMLREELELWPLFGIHFSVEEQNKMVGFILGTIGSEVLQSMLTWVNSALTEDEQTKLMSTIKQVTKNTMFSDWLNECWKGTSLSTSQTRKLETSISPKGIPWQMDHIHTFKSQKKNNLKNLMTSYWLAAQQSLPQDLPEDSCDGEDLAGRSPTFRDHEKTVYGCQHYKRNCKLRAACCGKLFTCRFCHDIKSDHPMDRKATTEMMCMSCLNIQPVGPICSTPSCNELSMAKYYCNTCKLFDDERNVYHCPFCNLCRVGKGLGSDYFHCMSCNCCLRMALVNHKCREKCLEVNCPICNEFLFTSSSRVRALPCGHYMHTACLKAYTRESYYGCPACNKSSGDMTMPSTQSSILVGGDESMEFFNCDKTTEMEASWANQNPEGRFFSRATFWVNVLCQAVMWFELRADEHYRFPQGLRNRLEQAVAGQKSKQRWLLCCMVLCIMLLFCVCTVLILLCFKALGKKKYIYLL